MRIKKLFLVILSVGVVLVFPNPHELGTANAENRGINLAQYAPNLLKNIDDVMELAATDLWNLFPKNRKFRIAVSSIKPKSMDIGEGLFRRINNALERALIRTGTEGGNILLARSVLSSVFDALEKEGLGKNPNAIRLELLDQEIADVIVVADYHKADDGIDVSLQAVRVKDGHVLAASREYRVSLEGH